jgi:L-amino acid N-acyltransferase YncA
MTEYMINKMTPDDWKQVHRIYQEGIDTGHATFEKEVPDWEAWDMAHLSQARLVARNGDTILGWGALSPVSSRRVYSGVAEVSLYVNATARNKGIGSTLMDAIIAASEKAKIWTLQAGIFPENKASLAMVKKHGFREVGRRERLGKMTHGPLAGTWRDVTIMERRSKLVGIQ